MVSCAYRPLCLTKVNPSFVNWNTPGNCLKTVILPNSEEHAYELSGLFFTSFLPSCDNSPYSGDLYAVASDFLFLESTSKLDPDLHLELCLTIWDSSKSAKRVSQLCFHLNNQSAIFLQSTEAGFLYALLWTQSSQSYQTRHEVKKYVKNLLKWLDKQTAGKEPTSLCPASIIHNPDYYYTIKLTGSQSLDNSNFFVLAEDQISNILDKIFQCYLFSEKYQKFYCLPFVVFTLSKRFSENRKIDRIKFQNSTVNFLKIGKSSVNYFVIQRRKA